MPALAALLVLVASERDASAQWAIGARAGYDLVEKEFSVGGDMLIPFADLGVAQVAAYPNIDAFFFKQRTIVRFDFDLAFPFRLTTLPLVPYGGVGFGIVYETHDFFEQTRFDLNLLGGMGFQTGTLVEPFLEVEASLFGTDTVAVLIGIKLFPMGAPQHVETVEEPVNPAALPQEEDY